MKLIKKLKKILFFQNKLKSNKTIQKEELLNNFNKINRISDNYLIQIKRKKNKVDLMLIQRLILYLVYKKTKKIKNKIKKKIRKNNKIIILNNK